MMEKTNQQDCMTLEALNACMGFNSGAGKYIHLNKLLQLLIERDIVITTQIATPALNTIQTELLRGRRVELINLIEQLKKVEI